LNHQFAKIIAVVTANCILQGGLGFFK